MKAAETKARPASQPGAQETEDTGSLSSPMPAVNSGWFRAHRNPEALELIRANQNAFVLLYVIAFRAQWKVGFNRHNLAREEALLGDHENYGMSERQYRTAKQKLQTYGFATFKTTNKGTVAKLANTAIFSVSTAANDGQNDSRPTSDRRLPRKLRRKKKEETAFLTTPERIGLERNRSLLTERIRQLEGDLYYDWDRQKHPEKVRQLEAARQQLSAIETRLLGS